MKRPASLDFETRGSVDLREVGVRPYFEHEDTSVLCMAWRIGEGPVQLWYPGDPDPAALLEHVRSGGRVIAHNNKFDRAAWNLKSPTHWPPLAAEQCDCTMARAMALNLPASLDNLGEAVGADIRKDKDGYRLMLRMCKPATREPLTWHETDDEQDRLGQYCKADVAAERDIERNLPPLSAFERQVWELDQKINARGVLLDQAMIRKASAVVDILMDRANKRAAALTGDAITKVTQTARIVKWLNDQGIPCESMAKDGLADLVLLVEGLGDGPALELVKLRAASAKAFKFDAMIAHSCADGRARDQLLYNGTLSRRWSGQGIQMHNMKRVGEEEAPEVDAIVTILNSPLSGAQCADALELMFSEPLDKMALCARACIIAEPGKKLVGGDYSNIEGRIAAWISGQSWKAQAFRDFDSDSGPDLYKVTAARILGIDVSDVTKKQRQETGKISELSLGYQGAVGALTRMAAKYGMKIAPEVARRIVDGWRMANAGIAAAWSELQDAAIEAVSAPGCVVSGLGGKVSYVSNGQFLFCRLPSGGLISYPSPSVAWKSKTVIIDGDEVEFNRRTVSFWDLSGGKRQIDLYGGMQFAHVVSGTARDVLAAAMLRADADGFELILTVHDELVCENDDKTAEMLRQSMLEPLAWLGDCPLAASTWEDERYVK